MTGLNGANFVDLLSPEDAGSWRNTTARLARASNALRLLEEKASSDTSSDVRAREQARALYFQTQRELSNLRDRLFASTPRLRSIQSGQPASDTQLETLAKASPGTLFLEWMMVDGKSTLLFALSAEGLQAFQLETGNREIRAISTAWRNSLALGASTPSANNDEPQLARKLSQLVLAEIEPILASGRYSRLVLVTEGPLLEVPFAALIDHDRARLIDHYAISNTVSLSFLLQKTNHSKPAHSLMAVADAIPSGEQRLVVPSRDRYGALRESLPEAKAVAAMFPDSLVLAGPRAREADVKRQLGEYSILHFATHGILDRSDSLRSGLLLAAEPADSSEDGILEAWEIAGRALSARLAVLSACETARGKEQLGDGLLGLAWAFQAAGVPRVIASLWSVDDTATSRLITGFYKHLKDGARVDDAMRKAILEMRKEPRHSSPFFWSAFEILGQAGEFQ
jgi:CHAT domain-containing protein